MSSDEVCSHFRVQILLMLNPTFSLTFMQYFSREISFPGKVTQNFLQGLVLFLLNMEQELPFLYLAMQRLSLPNDLTQTQPTPSIMKINGTKSLNNYSIFFKNAQVSKKEGSSDWLICQLSAKLHKWHNSRCCPHLCTHKRWAPNQNFKGHWLHVKE